MNYLMKNYKPYPISFEKGKGIYLYTKKNEEYIDAISGIGVCCLGHGDKKITKVISNQANKLLHTSNICLLYTSDAADEV